MINRNNSWSTADDFEKGEVLLSCKHFNKWYIGQTGRNFKQRFNEDLPNDKTTLNPKSKYVKHLIDKNHTNRKFSRISKFSICARKENY